MHQIGTGTYGIVFHGKWKGVEVAVKRFIKQKLTERRLLEFRAEMASLAELSHPNVVVFIGMRTHRNQNRMGSALSHHPSSRRVYQETQPVHHCRVCPAGQPARHTL